MKVKAKLTRKPAKVAPKKAAKKTVAKQTKSKGVAKKTKVASSKAKTSCKKASAINKAKPKTSSRRKTGAGNLQTIEIRIDRNLLKKIM